MQKIMPEGMKPKINIIPTMTWSMKKKKEKFRQDKFLEKLIRQENR